MNYQVLMYMEAPS